MLESMKTLTRGLLRFPPASDRDRPWARQGATAPRPDWERLRAPPGSARSTAAPRRQPRAVDAGPPSAHARPARAAGGSAVSYSYTHTTMLIERDSRNSRLALGA